MLKLPTNIQHHIISYLITIVDLKGLNEKKEGKDRRVSYLQYKYPRFSNRLWLQGLDKEDMNRAANRIQHLMVQNKNCLAKVIRHLKTDKCHICQARVQYDILIKLENLNKKFTGILFDWLKILLVTGNGRKTENYIRDYLKYTVHIQISKFVFVYIYQIYKRLLKSHLNYIGCLRRDYASVIFNIQQPIAHRTRRCLCRKKCILNLDFQLDFKVFQCDYRNYLSLKKQKTTIVKYAIPNIEWQMNRYHLNHILRTRELLKKSGEILMPPIFNYSPIVKT